MLREFFLKYVSEKPVIQISIINTPSERLVFAPKCSAAGYRDWFSPRNVRRPDIPRLSGAEHFGSLSACLDGSKTRFFLNSY
jgi:hypothetical protein